MTKSKMEKWVKALRSGKYKQARSRLREIDGDKIGYCCLGVLGEVCGVPQERLNNYHTLTDGMNKKCGIANEEGAPKYGYTVKVRLANQYLEFPSLASANDQGASFRAIATWIEKNYHKL